MKLALFKKENHWVIYERKENERIFRGRIIPFPTKNSFTISFEGSKVKVRTIPNETIIPLRLKSSSVNLKGLLFENETKKQISWHLMNSDSPFINVEQKHHKISISNHSEELAFIELHDNKKLELNIIKNELAPNILIGSIICLL
ncbi:MAG: hypothetical protein ACFFDW_00265 [Candidatus Thorarchaeota archaeon]